MQHETIAYTPVGDSGLLVRFGDAIDEEVNRALIRLWQAAVTAQLPGVVEMTPAFASLLLQFDPLRTDAQALIRALRRLRAKRGNADTPVGKTVEIPVCYGGAYGEDLPFVAEHAGLSEADVIRVHSERAYLIYMIGFLPGFPYLGGLDERLHTPRLSKPRVRIPAGSVGIGGEQTGIYPIESPGGWQLIGRTPLTLFAPGKPPRYQAGDRIRFVPIDEAAFQQLEREEKAGCAHVD